MVVLDTHAWVWWTASRNKLSQKALRATVEARWLGVSAVSCWEVAMLVRKGRLGLDRDVGTWVDRALAAPKVRFIELTPEIAVTAAGLDEIPGDPADRMIAASALIMKVPLVTKDEALRASRRVSTIW